MSCIVDGTNIRLSGLVLNSTDFFILDEGFQAEDVFLALSEMPADSPVTVIINSPGGDAMEGAAIHALLKARRGRTNVIIEGLAASAASAIAMAGDKISMSVGSLMMIHDPSTVTFGNSETHSKSVEMLEAHAQAGARMYADKSGKSVKECRDLMKAEAWFTPEEAVEAGFADEVLSGHQAIVSAFDYRRFRNAPQPLVALSVAMHWDEQTGGKKRPTNRKESKVTKPTPSVTDPATMAATARLKAILQSDEADGRKMMAEHLAFETTMEAEAAVKLLATAPKANPEELEEKEFEPRRVLEMRRREGATEFRSNGAGLNGSYGRDDRGRTSPPSDGLVTNMKRRHGIK